jgi:hypothetical protein
VKQQNIIKIEPGGIEDGTESQTHLHPTGILKCGKTMKGKNKHKVRDVYGTEIWLKVKCKATETYAVKVLQCAGRR